MKLEISTVIRLAKIVVDKYAQNSTQPGFIITENDQKIKVKFADISAALEELSKKDLAVVRRCKDCNNWHKTPFSKKGSCFPKDHDCGRKPDDYCSSQYIERSEEMRSIDERVFKSSPKK